MTDNLLQKLEEKMIKLLAELDTLRKEAGQLKQENAMLRAEHSSYAQKLQGLVSLLDSLETVTTNFVTHELRTNIEEFAHA